MLYVPTSPERRAANLAFQQAQQVVAYATTKVREALQAAAAKRIEGMRHQAGGEGAVQREQRRKASEEQAARERYLAQGLAAGGSEKVLLARWPEVWAEISMDRDIERVEATALANRQELLSQRPYSL
jgi:hypothetical protein